MDQQQPLVCPSHTTQYIVAVIIGILVGAGASFVYFKQAYSSTTGNSYQDGFDAAKKRVLESPMSATLRTPDDIRTISGVVTAVNGNRITIHTQSMNPFEDPTLDDRIIIVTADTKISKLSSKDPKVYQTEMNVFMKNMQSAKPSSNPLIPPTLFTSTSAVVADIIAGSIISVTAGENIKSTKEFSASEITIQPKLNTN